jgi:hypothetical protein
MKEMAAIAITLMTCVLASVAYIFCFTTNDQALGGFLPFLVIVVTPGLCYALGRTL